MKFVHALSIITAIAVHPAILSDVDGQQQQHHASLRGLGARNEAKCNQSRPLKKFPQWRQERGYWIGDLTLLGPDGAPVERGSWNYPYDDYKGFITGNIAK